MSMPVLTDYNLSLETGFIPPELPLKRLEDVYFEPWERIIDRLQALLLSDRLRDEVLNLPMLSISRIDSVREQRRAYVVLSFIGHAYIWGGPEPCSVRGDISILIPGIASNACDAVARCCKMFGTASSDHIFSCLFVEFLCIDRQADICA